MNTNEAFTSVDGDPLRGALPDINTTQCGYGYSESLGNESPMKSARDGPTSRTKIVPALQDCRGSKPFSGRSWPSPLHTNLSIQGYGLLSFPILRRLRNNIHQQALCCLSTSYLQIAVRQQYWRSEREYLF